MKQNDTKNKRNEKQLNEIWLKKKQIKWNIIQQTNKQTNKHTYQSEWVRDEQVGIL